MPLDDAEPPDNPIAKHNDVTLLQTLDEASEDVMGCLSVMVNDQDSENTQIQEVIVGDKLLGTTLTAITLPDGTQAYVTNNLDSDDTEYKETGMELENARAILIRDLSEFGDGKSQQFELEIPTFLQTQAGTSQDAENTYVQLIDGTTYMVTGHVDMDDDLWEIQGAKLKKDKTRSQHPCPHEGCGKVYSTPHHLKVHERSHTGQRPYRCTHPKCKKTFSTGYSLKAHNRTHTGEKPYKCMTDSCDKGFKTSGDLLKHVRTHTGERPFLCPFDGCGRSFTTSNIRKVHVRTHTGERPYKCSQCDKAFASATNFKNHVRIHSGEKPYACSVENCDRRFTEYSSLYKHQLVHTQQRPFECKICFRRYRQSSTLVMHKRTAHALIEGDDGVDIFLTDNSEQLDSENTDSHASSRQNKITLGKDGQIEITEATEDSTDNETQILLVGNAAQIAALQQMNLEEDFENSPIDTSLEALNIKIEDMEFGWT
ncbi:zinc finger protein 143-like isoform X2 [Venturia canescens]|uniref:zinc finger protein 143-like isoform X2 n=1 Tax=Venturia canescens TaxID=32260 RepID=UPI001C9CB19A|nr:zinc finger protein 143-like isoform X2 [Venturia canescens]